MPALPTPAALDPQIPYPDPPSEPRFNQKLSVYVVGVAVNVLFKKADALDLNRSDLSIRYEEPFKFPGNASI